MQKTILLSVATFFALSFAIAVAQEQEGTPTTSAEERLAIETKAKDSAATKGLKLEKEYKPRLPNGFGPRGVAVNPTQRDQIYALLSEYNEVIAMLELRIELLKEERDAKIDAVLTSEQQQRLNRPVRRIVLR